MPCINHGEKCEGGGKCDIDPHKDNGMLTAAWGSVAWVFLHCVTFGYPFEIDPSNPEHIEKQNDFFYPLFIYFYNKRNIIIYFFIFIIILFIIWFN